MTDYSQHGEQKFILDWFAGRNVLRGTYLDIGAHDGVTFSNTMALYELGWTGVCVEPRRDALDRLIQARPLDVAIRAAASRDSSPSVSFVECPDEDGMLSAAECTAPHAKRLEQSRSTVCSVPAVRIDRLAHLLPRIDFLSIDTEGTELGLLECLLLLGTARPTLICVEVNYEPRKTVQKFAVDHRYRIETPKPFGTINWFMSRPD